MDDYVMLIDVSGIDPLAPSNIARNSAGAEKAAESRDKKKIKHYADLEEKFEARVVPFVFDLLGGLSASAIGSD